MGVYIYNPWDGGKDANSFNRQHKRNSILHLYHWRVQFQFIESINDLNCICWYFHTSNILLSPGGSYKGASGIERQWWHIAKFIGIVKNTDMYQLWPMDLLYYYHLHQLLAVSLIFSRSGWTKICYICFPNILYFYVRHWLLFWLLETHGQKCEGRHVNHLF